MKRSAKLFQFFGLTNVILLFIQHLFPLTNVFFLSSRKTEFMQRLRAFAISSIFTFSGIYASEAQPLLHKSREAAIFGGSLAWTTANYLWQFSTPKVPVEYRKWHVAGVDQSQPVSFKNTLSGASDITLAGTLLLSGISLLNKSQSETVNKGIVGIQSIWITANLAQTTKLAFKRIRPYASAPSYPLSKRDDVYSFFSGHTAIAASAVTSAILMFSDQNATRNKILITSSGVLVASTAAFRIFSGKHYTSDVITGALLGIGIAWINYRIHEN